MIEANGNLTITNVLDRVVIIYKSDDGHDEWEIPLSPDEASKMGNALRMKAAQLGAINQ